MPIEVTARHMHANQSKEYAREKSEKLVEKFPRIDHVHVILDVEKHRCKAEVVIRGKNHIHVEAEETNNDNDMTAAIEVAFERAERQMRKLRDKVQEHRVHGDEDIKPE